MVIDILFIPATSAEVAALQCRTWDLWEEIEEMEDNKKGKKPVSPKKKAGDMW